MLREAAAKFTQWIFGGTCLLCRGAAQSLLCAACNADLPRLEGALCPRCALPSRGRRGLRPLPRSPAALRRDRRCARLPVPADVLVQALKFRGELALAALLGQLLAERIAPRHTVHFVVPVPLATRRPARARLQPVARDRPSRRAARRERDLRTRLCERARDTAAQMDLPLGRARAATCAARFAARACSTAPRRGGRRRDDHRRDARRGRGRAEARRRRPRRQLGGRTDLSSAELTDVRHRPVPAGNPAEHGKRDPPRGQHRRAAAPGRAARLFAWTIAQLRARRARLPRATRACSVHRDWACLR